MSSVAGVINKCVSCVAEAYRFFVRGKVGCTGSGYRRGEVRSEYQGVAFSVKEFIKLFGWDGSYFAAEYFKVFECRGFYVFIAILVEDAMDFLLYLSFLAAFAVVDVSYTFRGVENTLHGWSSSWLCCVSFYITLYSL